MRKNALRCLIALFGFLLVLYVVLLIVWGNGLERKIAEIRRQGQPVTLSDLAPEPVTDSQNGAVLYLKAFATTRVPPSVWSRGCPSDLLGVFLSSSTSAVERARLMPKVREAVERNEGALALAEQAASRPECVFPIKWSDGAMADFPHHSKLFRLTRLAAARAVVRAEDGEMDGALDDIVTALKIAQAVQREPTLSSYLQETVGIEAALSGLREAVRTQPLSLEQAHRMFDLLSKVDVASGLVRGMQGQRALVSWSYDQARRDLPSFEEEWFVDFAPGYGPLPPSKQTFLERAKRQSLTHLWRPLSYREQALYFQEIDREIRLLPLSYREMEARRIRFDPGRMPPYTVLIGLGVGGNSTYVVSRDHALAELGLARAAMALKGYKSRYREYPASLGAIKQRLGWRLPDDPFSGRPFGYRRVGKGFRIYSMGMNLKDDGGRTYEEIKPRPSDLDTNDIVWDCAFEPPSQRASTR